MARPEPQVGQGMWHIDLKIQGRRSDEKVSESGPELDERINPPANRMMTTTEKRTPSGWIRRSFGT